MSASDLGVVVVGTGFGCRIHVPAARAAGLEVVALVGRDRARAARRAEPGAPGPPWWFDTARGGGWLGASVSHLVDTVRCWLGEFGSVSAALPTVSDRDPATHAEDTAAARFRLRSGCEGVLQQSAAVW